MFDFFRGKTKSPKLNDFEKFMRFATRRGLNIKFNEYGQVDIFLNNEFIETVYVGDMKTPIELLTLIQEEVECRA